MVTIPSFSLICAPIDGIRDIHALVVIEVNRQAVIVFDPIKGERILPLRVFDSAWTMGHNLAILIEL